MPDTSTTPRVALLHTTPASTGPLTAAFQEWYPKADLVHITDDSLLSEVRAHGVTPAIRRRLTLYAMGAEATGARAILNCCSSVSETAALLRQVVALPVVQIDEPMAEAAVNSGSRIGVFATLESTLEPSVSLVERVAREQGKTVQVRAVFCEGAFAALQAGNPEGHDSILATCLHRAVGQIDVAVLAQASMARAESRLAGQLSIPVYGSLRLAVQRVREVVGEK